MGNAICCCRTRRRAKRSGRKGGKVPAPSAQGIAGNPEEALDVAGAERHFSVLNRSSANRGGSTWDAVSRFFGPPQDPDSDDDDNESFISVSVQSDMDLAGAPVREEGYSFAGCVPQLMPASGKPASLAVLPVSCVHKLKPGHSCLQPVVDGGHDHQKQATFSYKQADASVFNLRTKGYLKNRKKLPSHPSLYNLVQADLYTTNNKHWHIVRRLQLPDIPDAALPDGTSLDDRDCPPLLILHILMPLYQAQFFFPQTDGANCSFVYYFRLPEGFDPDSHSNLEAIGLLQRLARFKGSPDDNSGIRSQVKMIAQVANPQEWHDSGKINKTELKLLQQYNAKPVLMRPCMRFYRGKNYMEIDFDLHNFSYVARKGLEGYIDRLQPAIWDHGFCIEGRNEEELPEVLLAGVRGYFWDFTKVTPFPVPELLKHMPVDGSELIGDDGAGDHAEVKAALATGNLSVETVPIITSDGSNSDETQLPASHGLNTKSVHLQYRHSNVSEREREAFLLGDSAVSNASFLSAHSSLVESSQGSSALTALHERHTPSSGLSTATNSYNGALHPTTFTGARDLPASASPVST